MASTSDDPGPSTSDQSKNWTDQNPSHQTLLDELQSSTSRFDEESASSSQPSPTKKPEQPQQIDPDEWDSDENFVDTPPLSPSSECYRQKLVHLKEKFSLVQENTNRLRSRLYNIKKEISNMKRLKRVLINKLVGHGDEFYNLPLEIPDDRIESNDSNPSVGPPTKKRKTMSKKELGQSGQISTNAKRKSIVEETIAEMKAQSYAPLTLADPSLIQTTAT